MKKALICLFLLVAGAMNAQIVNIPDANFKNYLLNYNPGEQLDTNNDGEIQVTEAQAVTYLQIYDHPYTIFNNLTGLEAFTNVTNIEVNLYQLTSLDLSPLTQLTYVSITAQQLTSLNINGLTNLQSFYLQMGNIQSLDFSGMPNLTNMDIYEANSLTSLVIGNNTNFQSMFLSSSSLTALDLSGCPNMFWLNVTFMNEAEDIFINLKNGNPLYAVNSTAIFTAYYDNTQPAAHHCYVCVDEGEQENFDYLGYNVVLSTYCSFTPGGDYNTIDGTVSFDGNNNGCDAADAVIPFGSINITDGTATGSSSGLNGNYNFYTQAGTFTLTPQFENNWFTATPETVTFATVDNSTVTQNFCVTANGVHNDAEVTIIPLVPARPGFDAVYKIIYKNKGNQTLSGDITFAYDDAVLDYVSATPVENTAAAGSLTWNYSSLLPFESREIYVTLNVNSPMETPAVNIDDALDFVAAITPLTGDETPVDNTFGLKQTVVGSFDPNDITCLEGATVNPDKIGEYLHYNINFENTGTFPATFVVVKDIIDAAKFDVSSLVVLDASHSVETRVNGNKAEFIFDNINLAANGGKGNVTFKIKSLETLAINSSVTQKADIFFDYNWPIVTNEAVTTYALLNAPGFTKDASIRMYPNPAKNVVSITADSTIQILQLFDVQGRLLEALNVNDVTATLDIASRAKGIYFIKVATDKGVNVEKLFKE